MKRKEEPQIAKIGPVWRNCVLVASKAMLILRSLLLSGLRALTHLSSRITRAVPRDRPTDYKGLLRPRYMLHTSTTSPSIRLYITPLGSQSWCVYM
ncbi:hypothetical protein J6590_024337 [Homalodisca vitripennis]|nr:hypothetical protein J6590_024337 [Homalodisca vitripennis]